MYSLLPPWTNQQCLDLKVPRRTTEKTKQSGLHIAGHWGHWHSYHPRILQIYHQAQMHRSYCNHHNQHSCCSLHLLQTCLLLLGFPLVLFLVSQINLHYCLWWSSFIALCEGVTHSFYPDSPQVHLLCPLQSLLQIFGYPCPILLFHPLSLSPLRCNLTNLWCTYFFFERNYYLCFFHLLVIIYWPT